MTKAEPTSRVWNEILSTQFSTSSRWFRPKEGRTRLRLVLPKGEDEFHFYREVKTSYQGNVKSRYMVLANLIEGQGVTEEHKLSITPVILSKTVLKGLISLLVEGYPLFGKEAHGVTLTRTGQGLDTDYSVMPSKGPVDLPEDLVWPTESFDQLAETFTKGSLERDGKSPDSLESSPAPARKKKEIFPEDDF